MPQKQEDGVLTEIDASELQPALEPAKRQMIRKVERRKAAVFETGMEFTVSEVTKRFRVHPDRSQFLQTLASDFRAGIGLPLGASAVPFEATDGTVVNLIAEQIDGVGSFARSYRDFIALAELAPLTHIAAINAMTTVDAVLAYDITTGWPA